MLTSATFFYFICNPNFKSFFNKLFTSISVESVTDEEGSKIGRFPIFPYKTQIIGNKIKNIQNHFDEI